MLTPLQCAEQFELYAKGLEDKAANQRVHAETLPEGTARWAAEMMAEPDAAAAHQMRFAARFLREHAVLTWTNEKPIQPGWYGHRMAGSSARPTIRRVWQHEDENGLVVSGAGYTVIASLGPENEWCGPIALS